VITFKQFLTEDMEQSELFQNIYSRIKEAHNIKYIDGDIDLKDQHLHKLPHLSEVILHGSLLCSGNNLTNLIGAPKSIERSLFCQDCNLQSLEGCPEYIGGNFVAMNNSLTSLKYGPKTVSMNFNVKRNRLTNLKYSPESVEGYFNCKNNHISNLQFVTEFIGGEFQSDKFSDEEYRKYITDRKHLKSADTETQNLFGGIIDTL